MSDTSPQRTESAARPILVGVDASPGSEHALRWAFEEAAVRSAPLRAVHAWEPPASFTALGALLEPADEVRYETEARNLVEIAVEKARAHSTRPVATEAVATLGFPSGVLLAATHDADLLVLGTRGRGGFRGLLLGSVSQQCAHHTTIPLAIVPESASLPDHDDVVVGIDGSDASHGALAWAIDEAVRRNARLSIVHAWYTPVPVPPIGIAVTPIDPEVFRRASTELLTRVSSELLEKAARRPRDVELLTIEEPAAAGLLRRADRAGLLVLGTRGRGGFAGLLLGSVSQQCTHHATCAVVLVPVPTPT